jgi:hypothetical protein
VDRADLAAELSLPHHGLVCLPHHGLVSPTGGGASPATPAREIVSSSVGHAEGGRLEAGLAVSEDLTVPAALWPSRKWLRTPGVASPEAIGGECASASPTESCPSTVPLACCLPGIVLTGAKLLPPASASVSASDLSPTMASEGSAREQNNAQAAEAPPHVRSEVSTDEPSSHAEPVEAGCSPVGGASRHACLESHAATTDGRAEPAPSGFLGRFGFGAASRALPPRCMTAQTPVARSTCTVEPHDSAACGECAAKTGVSPGANASTEKDVSTGRNLPTRKDISTGIGISPRAEATPAARMGVSTGANASTEIGVSPRAGATPHAQQVEALTGQVEALAVCLREEQAARFEAVERLREAEQHSAALTAYVAGLLQQLEEMRRLRDCADARTRELKGAVCSPSAAGASVRDAKTRNLAAAQAWRAPSGTCVQILVRGTPDEYSQLVRREEVELPMAGNCNCGSA